MISGSKGRFKLVLLLILNGKYFLSAVILAVGGWVGFRVNEFTLSFL